MKHLSLWVCLLLVACRGVGAGPSASPPPQEEGLASARFDYLGVEGLPAGFDAQAHRGVRGLLPENTLPGFEAALDLGATTLELDLHFTADGHPVIWHDPIVDKAKCRLPEGAPDDVPDPRNPLRRVLVSQQPLATLQQYQCDRNPDANRFPEQRPLATQLAGADYRIITLDELFAFVAAYAESELKSDAQRANARAVQFNVETKRDPDHPEYIGDGFTGAEIGAFETAVLAAVAGHELRDRVIIQSFDHRSLETIRAVDGDIRLAALTTGGEAKIRVYWALGFDIWSPNARDVTPERLAEAREHGLPVIPWTVNDPAQMRDLIALGVDGLITDRIDLLLELDVE